MVKYSRLTEIGIKNKKKVVFCLNKHQIRLFLSLKKSIFFYKKKKFTIFPHFYMQDLDKKKNDKKKQKKCKKRRFLAIFDDFLVFFPIFPRYWHAGFDKKKKGLFGGDCTKDLLKQEKNTIFKRLFDDFYWFWPKIDLKIKKNKKKNKKSKKKNPDFGDF